MAPRTRVFPASAPLGLALLLAACATPQPPIVPGQPLPPQKPVSVQVTDEPGQPFLVYSVTPRIEEYPDGPPLPRVLTALGAGRARQDARERVFRATVEVTYAGPGRQRFDSISIANHPPAPIREIDHTLRCGQGPSGRSCLYTETVASFIPEVDLRAAAAVNQPLRFRLNGPRPVVVSLPPDRVRALLARMGAAGT
ncbi:hypothetical protein ACX4MT_14350 [Roseomonas mucosa]